MHASMNIFFHSAEVWKRIAERKFILTVGAIDESILTIDTAPLS